MKNSFNSRSILEVGDKKFHIYRLDALNTKSTNIDRLPYCLKILLENLLRNEDGVTVTKDDVEALASWDPKRPPTGEIVFSPARTLLQDFTGVPAIVDLAAMRDAMAKFGGDPEQVNPMQPVELVIDHSIQVDEFGTFAAFGDNVKLDYMRNMERYSFLKWGQKSFKNLKVVPPNSGIVHQINLEYLARVVFTSDENETVAIDEFPTAYPDSCVGTDSHTPMVNGLGVLAWGVGGIEAEATMLGQPISMLVPQVIGFKLEGALPTGATATDLVLTITELLRKKGVVGKFVEFFGPGVSSLALADRATIGNMSPEYGATCAIFPPDEVTLQYLRLTGRSDERIALVEAYMKAQGFFHRKESPEPIFSDIVTLDLATVEPSVAGPTRPQDRISLSKMKPAFAKSLPKLKPTSPSRPTKKGDTLSDGSIVIAALTSCTNTSNPSVMIAAGLLAKKAVERGLTSRPWVKTSLAPGSKVVKRYYEKSGLLPYLDQLGFNIIGYGCTTCIGNSGPLAPELANEIHERGLVAAAVLSGNRNFEGRIHPDVRANFLMSPPLVVAFALKGRVDWDINTEAIGQGKAGEDVFLKDIWPTHQEIEETLRASITPEMFKKVYEQIFTGDELWNTIDVPQSSQFEWEKNSTYIRQPPYFRDTELAPRSTVDDIFDARAIAVLGDSVTTDHISPAGNIKLDSPAGRYLTEHGVEQKDFNSYGSRRGNHAVMVRGTFANTRIRNRIAPGGVEGGITEYFPTGKALSIFDAAVKYKEDGTTLCVLAGKEYGSGSSRDWAAKGTLLQEIKFVIAESFERIHRSNLVGMGVLPLEFTPGDSIDSLGLTGREKFSVLGLSDAITAKFANGRDLTVRAVAEDGSAKEFKTTVRIDTPQDLLYFLNGGILPFVLRQLLTGKQKHPAISRAMSSSSQVNPDACPPDSHVDESSKESFPASDPAAY
ncbi:aconitate hydratase AcnA [soil metagenome]